MARQSFIRSLGFKKLRSISYGLVSAFVLFFLLFNSFAFVPEDSQLKWVITFLSYGVLGAYVFARADLRSRLFDVRFFRAMLIFVPYFFGTLIVLYFLFGLVNPFPNIVLSIFTGMPFWLLSAYAFIFSTIETTFWQGYLDEKIGILGSFLFAGIIHMFIWTGPLWLNFLGASALFFIFSSLNYWFGFRPGASREAKTTSLIKTNAVHTAYNFIKLGLILSISGVA